MTIEEDKKDNGYKLKLNLIEKFLSLTTCLFVYLSIGVLLTKWGQWLYHFYLNIFSNGF